MDLTGRWKSRTSIGKMHFFRSRSEAALAGGGPDSCGMVFASPLANHYWSPQGELSDAPCILRAPAARGLVAVGLTGGSVLLVDPRAKMAAQHSIAAHTAGLADVDVRGDMLATCGYGTRQGQIISDSYVKVLTLTGLSTLPTYRLCM